MIASESLNLFECYRIHIESKAIKLILKRCFNTAHSSSTIRTNFIVKTSIKSPKFAFGSCGFGQCGLPPKKPYCYISDVADCQQFIIKISNQLAEFNEKIAVQKQMLKPTFQMLYNEVFAKENFQSRTVGLNFFYQKHSQLTISDFQSQLIYFYSQIFFLRKKGQQLIASNPAYKSAKSALQFSLLDLIGQLENISVIEILSGNNPNQNHQPTIFSFYTVSYEENLESMIENAKNSLAFTNCIKIKFNNDIKKLIQLLVIMYNQNIGSKWIIDANGSWTPSDFFQFQSQWIQISNSKPLLKQKMLFIEQPFPIFKSYSLVKSQKEILVEQEEWKNIKSKTTLIIIADESFSSLNDLDEVMNYSHGINIKMQKCGGPFEAMKIVKQVNQRKIGHLMFGSMVSTHLGCTQTFQFSNYANYFDIDGALLIKQPQINGGFQWKGSQGIKRIKGKGLALNKKKIQSLFNNKM